jgi:hypothetical protein
MIKLIMVAGLSLAFLGNASVGTCGVDFARSSQEGVPYMFCWTRQDAGHVTFGGQLNLPCEGEACPVPNNVENNILSL